ncbi:MAG TPA: AarF/ABC1/UbiB kinase family protein [Marmoricola sp.]|nr:AarF/ABC1/UbiB kinase family protein [Nocardioidaceae bacterium]MCB8993795.1 AarF/ABC1/UbiB kinase family protein [Nocardioidaceae bacterium]MCO5324149.1 AarF/ABC1/UbiB kinase family protein [Nocardioidaceae bacterium]HRV69443.1 AarF/ABC1/UbiB kinase family protein [Marmoricola sp.]
MAELPRKSLARTAKLAALPLGYAGRSALGLGKRLGGASAEMVLTDIQQRTAEQLFRTLGELKGGAMKAGQAMSIFEAALPEELTAPYRENLRRLQDSAPPMPTITVREILAEQLGPDWQRSLVEFDAEPAAAASIGQVHRGRWVDGREVAIKVQYPGADKALYSDLKQLSRLAGSLSPILPGIDVSALMKELRDRAVEELDYDLEAESQQRFADLYAGDPDIVIPNVVRAAPKVIVSEWMDSTGSLLSIIEDGTTEQRDHYGQELAKFLFGSPSRVGMLHADPHPGNFRLIPTDNGHPGKLGVLDFGAVARLPEGNLPTSLGTLIRIAAMDDYDELVNSLREGGFIKDKVKIDPQKLKDYLGPFVEPTEVDEFHFTRKWMRRQFNRINDPKGDAFSVMTRLNLPPEYLLIHRTWTGGVGVLSQLEARVRFRELMIEHLPGFADPDSNADSDAD